MSEVNHASLWFPPEFPLQGRLPGSAREVRQNVKRQSELERRYHDSLCEAAGRRLIAPCCKTLHVSLFFDGTGNNLNNDLYLSEVPHPTNIARLFRASIGAGHAGGTGHNAQANVLTDADGVGNSQYFKYYMPGVGTPFAEVGDLDFSTRGLAFASYGEARINWGLLMIIDALRRALGEPRLDNSALLAAVNAMATLPGFEWSTGRANRYFEFRKQLDALAKPLRIALTQPQPGQPKLLGIRLYVYGFSRGAAAARAFVSWLNRLLARDEPEPCLKSFDMKLPVSVEYLGLLDTVASVGAADIAPWADGHMGWADGSQELPESTLVKRCLHLIASHEQRLCFPLESIRREKGVYPANSMEVLYPGVHSDQGGGYPPGDQGKAVGKDDRLLMSQIALNDLYADAFANGAPLKVPKSALPPDMNHEIWRVMDLAGGAEFVISPTLVSRFNAWRHVTLGLHSTDEPDELSRRYDPKDTNQSVEQALRRQMDWITAWRIDRYGFSTLLNTPFYEAATDTQAKPSERQKAEAARNEKQKEIERRRAEQLASEHVRLRPKRLLEPGTKDFDADMAQTQLREGAEEFAAEYRGPGVMASVATQIARLAAVPGLLAIYVTAEARAERERMKAGGQALVSRLFPPPPRERNHLHEHMRGNVVEDSNATEPEGLLRALFDDHVHDSRAWFLYSLGRESGGTYFTERMVFFGDSNRRDLAMYSGDDEVIPTLLAGDSPRIEPPVLLNAERLAEMQEAVTARWEAYCAERGRGNDANV